jgi:hypothetical protein
MQAVRTFGRFPRQVRGIDDVSTNERNLAYRLRRARAAGHLTAEDEAELATLESTDDVSATERNLAYRLRRARAAGHLRADLMQALRTLGRPGAASTVLDDDENARELQGVSLAGLPVSAVSIVQVYVPQERVVLHLAVGEDINLPKFDWDESTHKLIRILVRRIPDRSDVAGQIELILPTAEDIDHEELMRQLGVWARGVYADR